MVAECIDCLLALGRVELGQAGEDLRRRVGAGLLTAVKPQAALMM